MRGGNLRSPPRRSTIKKKPPLGRVSSGGVLYGTTRGPNGPDFSRATKSDDSPRSPCRKVEIRRIRQQALAHLGWSLENDVWRTYVDVQVRLVGTCEADQKHR